MYKFTTKAQLPDDRSIFTEIIRQYLNNEYLSSNYKGFNDCLLVTSSKYVKVLAICILDRATGVHNLQMFYRECPKTISEKAAYKLLTSQLDEVLKQPIP